MNCPVCGYPMEEGYVRVGPIAWYFMGRREALRGDLKPATLGDKIGGYRCMECRIVTLRY